MRITKPFYQFISWLLIGFMLLANLANLATNSELNESVCKAYSATSLSEYYTTFADTSIKIITNFVIKITNGQINPNTNQPVSPSNDNKKEKKSSENVAVILSVPNIKDLTSCYVLSSNFAIISKFNLNKIDFVSSIFIKIFCIISLFLACFIRLARSDTEDNNKIIKNNNIKFRLA